MMSFRNVRMSPDRCRAKARLCPWTLPEFHGPGAPGGCSEWMTAKDKLSLSLLQERLIDLGRPIDIAEA